MISPIEAIEMQLTPAVSHWERAFSMGAADYLVKPAGPVGLKEAVALMLRRSRWC